MPDLKPLLDQSSRTFALAIPLLPEPTRREVTTAYLLFRIADTFEDGERWPVARRLEALADFCRLLEHPMEPALPALAQRWSLEPPTLHNGYVDLLAHAPLVFGALAELTEGARHILTTHIRRTTEGMALVLRRGGEDGRIQLRTGQELDAYCYAVAGIVGEMLTELFLLGRPSLVASTDFLRARAARFGEGLQLVNILKDSDEDGRAGRTYLPPGIPRDSVMAQAERDLEAATEYSHAMQEAGAPRGLVAFTALPVLLARAALHRLKEDGPGAKVSRAQVAYLYGSLQQRLDAGLPAITADAASQPAV